MAVAVAGVAAGLGAGGWAGARACGWCKGQVFGFEYIYVYVDMCIYMHWVLYNIFPLFQIRLQDLFFEVLI